jgi:hypothetical protein
MGRGMTNEQEMKSGNREKKCVILIKVEDYVNNGNGHVKNGGRQPAKKIFAVDTKWYKERRTS